MKIGITATQKGVTQNQLNTLHIFLKFAQDPSLGHGDCIGGDAQAHSLFKRIHPNGKVKGFPPINPIKRSFCQFDEVQEPKEYLERNKDIVDWCDLLIALPKGDEEVRSGTWATIRYTKKVNRFSLFTREEYECIKQLFVN